MLWQVLNNSSSFLPLSSYAHLWQQSCQDDTCWLLTNFLSDEQQTCAFAHFCLRERAAPLVLLTQPFTLIFRETLTNF